MSAYQKKIKKINTSKPTFIDLCAGIGGIRLGFEKHGFECIFSSEWDSKCQQVYNSNFHEIPKGDLTKIKSNEIPSHDVLCAGFPCQPFSISGKKGGLTDERSNIIFSLLRIIKDKKPKIIFLENVKNLIYLNDKTIFKFIISSLEDLGYIVTWKILNASNFGIPQNRDRVIIIASNKKFDFDKIKIQKSKPLSHFLDKDTKFEFLDESYTLIPNPKIQKSGLIFVGYRNKKIRKVGVRPNTEHLSRVHKMPNRIYSSDGIHPTIPSQETARRFWIYHENKVRKLTIDECYRIMGFPSNFSRSIQPGTQVTHVGNSVPIPMIESLAEAINQQLLQ
jgi:DNA (cytosine-5)-methyltransferase 1